MNGPDLVPILKRKGIDKLYHANTVTTSCTFLQEGGLASRGYVDAHGLKQTPQASDATDKRYCIWHDVFFDTDDIHARIGNLNFYGPVLFTFDVDVLNQLPTGTEVRVTKSNPHPNWSANDTNADRYFLTTAEVGANLVKGRFDHMIVLRTPQSILPFPSTPVEIVVDDPKKAVLTPGDPTDAFIRAEQRLKDASRVRPTLIALQRRSCAAGCSCATEYARRADLRHWFDVV